MCSCDDSDLNGVGMTGMTRLIKDNTKNLHLALHKKEAEEAAAIWRNRMSRAREAMKNGGVSAQTRLVYCFATH